ncbi:hypothetical protein [Burkholderia pseudomallei]|jgi:hypothetical protein|uniref:hypothetical protein n=1 Tax=Burkholderia pseudomallei TaxID=28450 RepID=UPI0024DF6507|nr:hypothetical protein [Burkholderia pseudomallei]
MIRDLRNKEKLINEFMESCRWWLSVGKPWSSVFSEGRAICESLDYFLGQGGRPVHMMDDYERRWMEIKVVRGVLKEQFTSRGLDNIYPFNEDAIRGGADDSFCRELDTATVWENEGRVNFVMNFKPLAEIEK